MLVDFLKYLLISLVVFAFILLIQIIIRKKRRNVKNWILGVVVISISWIIIIYWFPPMKVYQSMRSQTNLIQSNEKRIDSSLILAEFEKVSQEISENSQDNKRWFYYKLILVGALIGAIIAQVLKNGVDNIEFMDIISRKFFTITVGLAFALCVVIDIQVKQNLLVTNQLGSWIAYHFEPIMIEKSKLNEISDEKNSMFKGWEEYLRAEKQSPPIVVDSQKMEILLKLAQSYLDDSSDLNLTANDFTLPLIYKSSNYTNRYLLKVIKKNCKKDLNYKQQNIIVSSLRNEYNLSNSTHTDIFYSIFHFPAFHILTWLLYAFYIISFYHFVAERIIDPPHPLDEEIILKYKGSLDFIFWTVNLMILLIAILSRAQSGIFEMQFSLFSNQLYTTPIRSGLFNLFLAFIFIVLPNTLVYVIGIRKKYLA